MKFKLLILIALLIISNLAFASEIKQKAEKYNDAFYANDFINALKIIRVLLQKRPENLAYKREYIKMLGATGKKNLFIKEMLKLRTIKNPKAIPYFFEILKFEHIPKFVIKDLKFRFELEKDEFILNHWDEEKLIATKDNLIEETINSQEKKDGVKLYLSGKKPSYSDPALMKNLLCYVSRTGKKYHKIKNCSKGGQTTLIPMYDLNKVEKRTTGPCKNCWSGPPLF